MLTLYTTPVIYLAMERLKARLTKSGSGPDSDREPPADTQSESRQPGRCRSMRAAPRSEEQMNFSRPFINRPIGTTLLSIGLFLVGVVAYLQLPVASMPTVEFPTIRVNASRPGADPATMAATVAAPLERRLGEIAGVSELTSVSGVGSTSIALQFDLTRKIDGAARDVQAALNAAMTDLPSDLPTVPTFKKVNPAAAPVLILALTSKTLRPSAIYDIADSIIGQRISQVRGVADVNVSGAQQPAIRIRANPTLLASMGVSMDEIRNAVAAANAASPLGVLDGPGRAITLAVNDQMRTVDDYKSVVVKTVGGTPIMLSAVAEVTQSTVNRYSAAMFNKEPSVLLIITKQADANVIDTVDGIKALIPELKRWIPAGIEISVLSDRTTTIRASVADMQLTLTLSVILVMLVVFVFLRRASPTMAAGITVPLSLAGTCALMWAAGFSINNLTLMALAVSVGFVVDDAIVMIENMYRNLEQGKRPMVAALEGAGQIGFTVVSISVSLIAAFIPLLFMGGVVGRLLREFSLTMVFAIIVSTVVSLSVTAMICAHFVKAPASPDATRFDRVVERFLGWLVRGYERTLKAALNARALMLFLLIATAVLTVRLYIVSPKGYFPQDDTGPIIASMEGNADVSFDQMRALQIQARRHGAVGQSGAGARLLRRRGRLQFLDEPGPHVHQPETVGGARRSHNAAGDQPPAQGARGHPGAERFHEPRRRHPHGREVGEVDLPVHAVGHRHRRALRLGAEGRREAEDAPRADRRLDRSRGRRPASQHRHRPRRRRPPRHPHRGHRHRAQQRLRATPDLDHLRHA